MTENQASAAPLQALSYSPINSNDMSPDQIKLAIETGIANRVGELILVARREIKDDDDILHDDPWLFLRPRFRSHSVTEEIYVGITKKGPIKCDTFRLKIPTDRYTIIKSSSHEAEAEVLSGDLAILIYGVRFGRMIESDEWGLIMRPSVPMLEVVIGNQEVREWFETRRNTKGGRIPGYLMSFYKISRALNFRIPEYSEVSIELDKKRKQLIEVIITLHFRRIPLQERIKEIRARIGSWPIETETDAFFVTCGEREDLERINQQIGTAVKEAKRLGVTLEEVRSALLEITGIKASFNA